MTDDMKMELSLNGETFRRLKDDFDSVLNRTIGNMEMKGADEAAITVKLSISLDKDSVEGEDGYREITRPTFKHDISSVMQVKDKMSGTLNGNYEIVYDEESGKYVMRKVEDGQTSMFDDDGIHEGEFVDVTPEEPDVKPIAEIEGTAQAAIPENASKDVVDEDSTFSWMSQFIGNRMTVVQDPSDGECTVKTVNGDVVFTSSTNPRNAFYLSADKMEKFVGHELTCCLGTDDDQRTFIYLRSETNGEIVTAAYEDDEEDDSYEYEEPED